MAHDAGLDSVEYVKEFWNSFLRTTHSDENVSVLGKTISKELFIDSKTSKNDCFKSAGYNQMIIGNTDHILCLNAFSTFDWFEVLFIETFTLPSIG